MSNPQADKFHIEPSSLTAAISAYQFAADDVAELANDVFRSGRLGQPWADDVVSHSMKDHYNSAVFDGNYSTYVAIVQYERGIREAIRTLQQILTDYQKSDTDASERLGRTSL